MEDDVDGSDPLAIVYTSGSTSAPKGVGAHPRRACSTISGTSTGSAGSPPTDKLFCNSPFFWIGGFAFGLLATLVAGSTLVCSNAVDAGATLDLLEAEKPTMTNGFVAGVDHLTQHPSFAGATCRRCGAATCTRSWRRTYDRPTRNCGTTCWA